MDRFVRSWMILALASLACGLVGPPQPASSSQPSPTQPATTVQAPAASPSSALTEAAGPAEAIWIQTPGNGSRLVGQVHIEGEAEPTFEQTLVVQVVALDQEPFLVLVQQAVIIGADAGVRGAFVADLAFDLGAASDRPGAVNVFSTSPRDGGITHLASNQVTLTGGGSEAILEGESGGERITIHAPASAERVTGGTVHVEGETWASFEQTLLVEVIDVTGAIVGSSSAIIQGPDMGLPGPFAVDVAYSLTAGGPGRIVVRDVSAAFGQTLHQSTVDVDLGP